VAVKLNRRVIQQPITDKPIKYPKGRPRKDEPPRPPKPIKEKYNSPVGGRPKGTTGIPRRAKKDLINYKSIEKMYAFGMTDEQVSQLLNIRPETVVTWKRNSLFNKAREQGLEYSNTAVKKALYERATGYRHLESDIKVIDKEIVETVIVKQYPPDVQAIKYWLNNKDPENWKDRTSNELTGPGGKDLIPIPTTIVFDFGEDK
jgi:cell fate (sporulation/competence/biofilm development) regulator YmcA (YheA/YmcA/DUF963 family)